MSSASYITLPIETDPTTLSVESMRFLMTAMPGWQPHEGNLDVWIIEVFSRLEAETRDVGSSVSKEIFRYFGKSLIGLPAIDGAPASATSTWTMRDTAGYLIPAGTLVAYNLSGTSQAYFTVVTPVTIPPGQNVTGTGEVELRAVVSGTSGNGLDAGVITLVDSLAFVTSVNAETETSGGVDPETDDAYLNRLRAELQLLSPNATLPSDFAALALNVAGVARAVGIDNYNPADNTYGNERMVAVAVTDPAGDPVSSDIKQNVQDYLEARRELNFVVNVIDPTFTTIDVNAQIVVTAGADVSLVTSAAIQALEDFLQPFAWPWQNTLYYNQLIAVIASIPGVRRVVNISTPSGDLTLGTVASLVRPGNISVTAVPGSSVAGGPE